MAISLAESAYIGLIDVSTRKVRTAVTLFGIVLGVMSIMVVLAIVNGMNEVSLDWMQQRGGLDKIQISMNWDYDFSRGGEATFSMREVDYLRSQLEDVEAFNPQVQAWGSIVQFRDSDFEASAMGVYPDLQKVEDWELEKGRFINLDDIRNHNNVIVLGSTVAENLFRNRNPLGQYVTLNKQQLMVIGVLKSKYWKNQGDGAFSGNVLEYMNRQVFLPLSTMIAKVNPNLKVSSIEIKVLPGKDISKVKRQAEDLVLNIKRGKQLFRVSSAQEEMQMMKKSMVIFTVIFFLIAMISLLVGGIVITNIMLASVKERTREIGVRIAVGARGKDILIQFLVQTMLVTTLGGVFGIFAGIAILDVVAGFLDITLKAAPNMIWVALLVSASTGLIFGIGPAYKASKLDPVKALMED
ncbi:MAG: ABC transporter permease [Candidatus Cloacimonadaceae bacterium]|jgi:putative ABC transport system permease protein